MIDLEFFDSSGNTGVIKATVHKTGKLGFNSGASKLLKLEAGKHFNIGFNKADANDTNLYLLPVNEPNEKSFKVIKAGEYYYIHIKNILRERKIDYKNESVSYEIDEIEQNGKLLYRLERRNKK
ncbi:hypothetical protein ABH942_001628 [Flavobacterium sp. 28YEA47A]|uniref:hypothetical protein n=1 Tax=Flavobacterium sp. 28YEA47A TaxID=3156276 RepID=UPI0035197DCF